MLKIDSYGLELCKYQANLFATSLNVVPCSSAIFLRRFMNSRLAQRMDSRGFLFESISLLNAIQEIETEFGFTDYGKVKYSTEELYWIGYLYRYWCYTEQISSKRVYKIIKPEELRELYFSYHSFDPAQAIDRIKEAKGIMDVDNIDRGVELLRKIRAKKNTNNKKNI